MLTESSPMRVLQVAARYFPYMGGVETHLHEVGPRLARAGVEITILTTDLSGRLPVVEESEGMQIRRVPAWPTNRDYYFAPDIYRFIMRRKWQLIHCQGYHNLVAPLAMFSARRANIPYLLTFHSGGDVSRLRTMLRGLHWTMLRPLLSHAQKLIAVSQFEANFFRERLRLPPEQFVVIPNGAHLEIPEQVETETGERVHEPLIVSIGRLERYKGHQRVIAALPKVLEHIPSAGVRIVGTGPYEHVLREKARKLGVSDRVEIRAVSPEDRKGMASVLARASLVVLLSEYEAHPIAILEALALQRPVLVASTSGLQELADRGLARSISLKSTPQEVAMAIIGHLRQPGVTPNITLPGWDDCAANLLALYRTIARGEPCAS